MEIDTVSKTMTELFWVFVVATIAAGFMESQPERWKVNVFSLLACTFAAIGYWTQHNTIWMFVFIACAFLNLVFILAHD